MCIFCQIIKKKIPTEIIYEDKKYIVFKDINPRAPIHVLIMPKKHIVSLAEATKKDKALISGLMWQAKILAEKLKIDKSGYKLILNCGREAGQIVGHIHLHLLGGGDYKNWGIYQHSKEGKILSKAFKV